MTFSIPQWIISTMDVTNWGALGPKRICDIIPWDILETQQNNILIMDSMVMNGFLMNTTKCEANYGQNVVLIVVYSDSNNILYIFELRQVLIALIVFVSCFRPNHNHLNNRQLTFGPTLDSLKSCVETLLCTHQVHDSSDS